MIETKLGLAALLITVGLCIAALGLAQLYVAKEQLGAWRTGSTTSSGERGRLYVVKESLGTWRVYDNTPAEKVEEARK